jgi:hypothetical protein
MADAQIRTTTEPSPRSRSVFKADHPREIDSHINFFGGGQAPARDMCGEALLDALMNEASADDADEGCA